MEDVSDALDALDALSVSVEDMPTPTPSMNRRCSASRACRPKGAGSAAACGAFPSKQGRLKQAALLQVAGFFSRAAAVVGVSARA